MASQRATQEELLERMFQASVSKAVSTKLGSLSSDFGDFTKGMSETEKGRARLMMLEMVEKGCQEFCTKIRSRLNKGDEQE